MYSAPDANGNSHLISPNTDIGINDAPSGGGSLFGDISTHTSPDGLKAVPSYSACLDPISCPKRYWDKQWTVSTGDKTVAGGFGDVQLLGNGSFAATPHGGGAYQIYSGSTGNAIATDKFTQVQALDGGLVAGLGSDNQWHIMDQAGQVLGTQWADGSGTCNVLVKAGMSAFLNHGVATAPVYESCGSYYSSSSAASKSQTAPAMPQSPIQLPNATPSKQPSTNATSKPPVGGISTGGQQEYVTVHGTDAKAAKASSEAEVVSHKKR
jgi:hypothetical protein